MNRLTTLLLLLIVLGLGTAVWWQSRREARGDYTFVEPLFKGVDADRVEQIFFDNLERSTYLRFERDEHRTWSITDPIAYSAENESIEVVLDVIERNPAIVVPDAELVYAEESFEPPRAVVEVSERVGEELRVTRVEIGALDVDGSRVFVRTRGRIYRTWRNLDTMLQRTLDEYRSHRVFEIPIREVIEVHRSGVDLREDSSRDLALEARRQGYAWWMDKPYRAQLDPQALSVYVAAVGSLRTERFVDDDPADLSIYGLDRPDITVELFDRRGGHQAVLFASDMLGGSWFCKRADQPAVFGLDEDDVFRVKMPVDQMLDRKFLRALRDDVQGIEILGEHGTLRVAREPGSALEDARWSVAERLLDTDEWSVPVAANPDRVEDLLTTLEQAELTKYLRDVRVSEAFPPSAPRRGAWVDLTGDRQGGRIGERYRSETGSQAFLFHRDQEDVVALAPVAVGELLGTTLRDLQSLQILELDEVHLRKLSLRQGSRERTFERAVEGTWRYVDMDAEATELHPVLDALFFLRASEHIPEQDREPLSDVVTVEIGDAQGTWHRVEIGVGPGGRVECERLGLRSVVKDQTLHGKLLAVLRD